MKIFHIELAKIGMGMSGGETSMVEVIRFLKKKDVKNILITTDNGKQVYEGLGLREDKNLTYVTIDSYWTEKKFHLFISYCIRPFLFLKIKRSIVSTIEKEDILMCHSEFIPNFFACMMLSKYFARQFYWFHMASPKLFRGFLGQYTNTFHWPNPRLIHYMLGHALYIPLSKRGKIISITPYYSMLPWRERPRALRRADNDIYSIKKYSGYTIDYVPSDKKYDLVFMGRFHQQKGLFEIPKILKLLKEKKRDIRMLVIGGGDENIKSRFFKEINENGLEENLDYAGFLVSDDKFKALRSAKIFILPSYYESFGQVVLEAMANGLPVVAYDLPVYSVFEKGMIRVNVLNNEAVASEILQLLSDEKLLQDTSASALVYSHSFSWDKTGQEIYDLIQRQY